MKVKPTAIAGGAGNGAVEIEFGRRPLACETPQATQRDLDVAHAEFDIAGGRFAEVVGQIKVVKSFGAEARELSQFSGRYDSTVALTREQSTYWHRMDVARRGALNVIFFGIYAIIFVATISGSFTPGSRGPPSA